MTRLTVRTPGMEPWSFELSDEEFELWSAIAAARGQTLDESFEELLEDFMASHPIIAQTRTVQ